VRRVIVGHDEHDVRAVGRGTSTGAKENTRNRNDEKDHVPRRHARHASMAPQSTADEKKGGLMNAAVVFGFVLMILLPVDVNASVQSPQQTPQITPTSVELERRDQPVTNDDLRILQRAADLLKNESVWNRKDDRECDDDEATGKRSLFCALQKACIDILGAYDHRRVALQEVRFAVEDATRGQEFEHRLRDFNNLPTTQLADIKKVLQVATDRVKSRMKDK
jgi:hypothetical protein